VKVIGICGSPHKGNSEWMLSTLLEKVAESGADVELLLLRKMDVRMCRGCLACEAGGKERKGICVIKDDMAPVLPKLLAADAIVLATPVYFSMLSGRLKNFMDRTCPIWTGMEGKKLAGLAVAEEDVAQTISNLKVYASLCKMRWVGGVTTLAKKPGDASQNKSLKPRLKRLAQKITG
jgi:multimeric flavodoxin WrbA